MRFILPAIIVVTSLAPVSAAEPLRLDKAEKAATLAKPPAKRAYNSCAAFGAGFVLLMVYRGNLTRYEDDQLFLTENNENEHQLQDTIQRRVNSIRPFVHIFGGISGLLTFGIVGIYVWDAWQKIQ